LTTSAAVNWRRDRFLAEGESRGSRFRLLSSNARNQKNPNLLIGMNERKGLSRELRDHYSTFLQRLPLELVVLARKIRGSSSVKDPSFTQPLGNPLWNSFDPETVAILNTAFEKAWHDLDHLTANPATRSALATRLIALLNEGERNPSRLATKAVLELVAPRERFNGA